MRKKIIDLFSGAGGLTEGFRSNDFDIVSHVEKEAAACETLQLRDAYYYLKNKNKLQDYYDFMNEKISLEDLFALIPEKTLGKSINEEINDQSIDGIFSKIDVALKNDSVAGVIGGPPCQAYSTIGRARNAHKKDSDGRIYLYRYYIDFLTKYNPDFFVFENVKGLLSFKDADGQLLFPKMRAEFESAGFALDYQVVNTADYGVSQIRERIIIFGTPIKFSNNISQFFTKLNAEREERVPLKEIFSDMPFMHAGEINNHYRNAGNSYIQKHYKQDNSIPLTQNIARPNTDNDLEIYKLTVQAKMHGKNLRYDQLSPKLQTHHHIDKFLDRYKALDWETPSHTVVAHIAKDGHHYIHPDIEQNRSITVREAARIQGFPDSFYFESSRTAAFTQIGNAVPPILSKKIATVISHLG